VGCTQTLKDVVNSHGVISNIRPAQRCEKGIDVYGGCFRVNDGNIPWVIAVLIGSIPFEHARRWHTRGHLDIETRNAEHPDTSHLR
jgi:hypothetical protein